MGFVKCNSIDLIEPGVKQMYKEGESFEEVINTVARGFCEHKKWRKPAKRMVNEVVDRIIAELNLWRGK